MVKQTFTAPTNQEGEQVSLTTQPSNGVSTAFLVIPPASYAAIMTSIKEEVYPSKDGSKMFMKVCPEFTLLNDNGTILNRQDFTVGNYDPAKKSLYHPEGKFPIWGGASGALFLFKALGLFRELEDGKYEFEFDANLVKDRVVRVRTGIAGYVKGNTPLSNTINTADGFNKMANEAVAEISQGSVSVWGMEDLRNIAIWFNEKHGLDSENGLKTKNVVLAVYPVSEKEISDNGWYLDAATGSVFTSEAGYHWYTDALENTDNSANNDW